MSFSIGLFSRWPYTKEYKYTIFGDGWITESKDKFTAVNAQLAYKKSMKTVN